MYRWFTVAESLLMIMTFEFFSKIYKSNMHTKPLSHLDHESVILKL